MTDARDRTLTAALQRAFIEAGEPSVASVAARAGVSRQRLSAWRAGRHVPAQFDDLEPVILSLELLAAQESGGIDVGVDRVTAWSREQWRATWQRSVTAQAVPTAEDATRDEATAIGSGELSAAADKDPDRQSIALAVTVLLATLVGALAVAAFLLSVYAF